MANNKTAAAAAKQDAPEAIEPTKPAGYRVNWGLKGAGKLEIGKVYKRESFAVTDEQFAALLANGTISEA